MNYLQFASDGWFPGIAHGSGTITISTFVDGGRNAQGDFIGQVVGDDKYKYEILFNTLTPEEIRELLRRFDRTQGGKFVNDFYVFDPARRDIVRKTMYVGDRTGEPFRVDSSNGQPERWLNVVANLIEV